MKKKTGAPRKYSYKGTKKITSIRLTDEEKELIFSVGFESIQEFVQYYLKRVKRAKPRKQ